MAKGNLFLGFGRGKVGDVVFSRGNGEQLTRARNRSPRNPRTAIQLLQRVLMKSNSLGYSLLQEIANHSFQGQGTATENQSRFAVLNIAAMRRALANVLIDPSDEAAILFAADTNYAAADTSLAPILPYVVSEGAIQALNVGWLQVGSTTSSQGLLALSDAVYPATTEGEDIPYTYQVLIDQLNLQVGDQITVLALTANDTEGSATGTFSGFHYGRFILNPSSGNLDAEIDDDDEWNIANQNVTLVNAGTTPTLALVPTSIYTGLASGQANTIVAMAYIVSRQAGGTWLRSDSRLVIRPEQPGVTWNLKWSHQLLELGAAVRSFLSESASSKYLNQSN